MTRNQGLPRLAGGMLGLCMTAAAMHGAVVKPAEAQDVQRIAAIVNDSIVSNYDVDMRLNLVLSSTGASANPEERRRMHQQILQGLVDEMLQVQEARENEISISESEIDQGITALAAQNNLTRGQFEDFLITIRSDIATIHSRIEAELMWSELVSRRLSSRLFISDTEVQGVLDRMKADAGKPEYNFSEILLTVDTPDQESEVKRSAVRLLSQLRGGGSFAALARQFSDGATSANGGDVGWVAESQLAPEIQEVLGAMRPGRITPPIRTASGFSIIFLKDRRKILTVDPMDVQLDLMQISAPVSSDALPEEVAALKEVMEARTSSIEACQEAEAVGKELSAASAGSLGSLKLGELPANIVNAVETLEIGHASRAVVGEKSIRVFLVCDRQQPKVEMPTFDFVEQQLTRQRLSLVARRYMRDLRRDAILDYK
ncbi:MAG: peptidylprolyl isomerase [Sphingomonadales bacterium]